MEFFKHNFALSKHLECFPHAWLLWKSEKGVRVCVGRGWMNYMKNIMFPWLEDMKK
jgi:hypothetical protein